MNASLLGIASALVKGRKYKLMLVGAQFVYLGYKYVKRKRKASRSKP